MTDKLLARRHRLITNDNRRWWTLGAMCFALFMIMLDNTVVNVALPSIQRDLHASLSALEWTVNAYTLTFAVLLVTGGRLGDIFGRRRLFLFATRESRDETVARTVDLPGIATITIGLTALILALVEGNSWHWGSSRVIALLAVAAVTLAAFVPIELRHRAPMVDFGFFRSRTFLGANLVAFIVSFAMLAQFFFLALYMQNILRYSPLQAGIRFLPATVVIIIMGPLAGRLTDRIGPREPMVAGLLIVALALFIQSQLTIHTGYGLLLPGFVLMGLGMGLTMSPMSTAAMNAVDRTKAGVASGVLSMSRMVGGTFGVAIIGALVTAIGKSKLEQGLPHLPAVVRSAIASALGSGAVPSHAGAHVAAVSREAFIAALSAGLKIGAAVTLVGAIVALALITRHAPARPDAQPADPDRDTGEAPAELSAA